MSAEVFSNTFKIHMREHLMADVLDKEIATCRDKFGPISNENAAVNSAQKVVGFYYLGETYDSPGYWKKWAKRIPLSPDLYGRADEVIAELQTLEENKIAIKQLITQALKKSKSVGDMFALLPDSYQPTMMAAIVDYQPGSKPTLPPEEIQEFLDQHEPVLTAFREYLMLRLLMG